MPSKGLAATVGKCHPPENSELSVNSWSILELFSFLEESQKSSLASVGWTHVMF